MGDAFVCVQEIYLDVKEVVCVCTFVGRGPVIVVSL